MRLHALINSEDTSLNYSQPHALYDTFQTVRSSTVQSQTKFLKSFHSDPIEQRFLKEPLG